MKVTLGLLRRCSLPLASLLVLAAVTVLTAPAPASAQPGVSDPQWYDGGNQQNQVTNCASLGVLSTPYSEPGVAAYTGYLADSDDAQPAVNQTTYLHYVVYGLGSPCQGTYFAPHFYLPSGVTWDTSQPIHCFYDGVSQAGDAQACPQWGSVSTDGYYQYYYSQIPGNAGTWPMAQGHHWEFQLPIRSNRTISGETLYTFVKTIDGEDNLTLATTAPLYVFGGSGSGQTAVMYDQPSTTQEQFLPGSGTLHPKYGVISRFQAVISGQAGQAFVEIGTQPGSYPKRTSVSVGAGQFQSFELWTDWEEAAPLVRGRTYYWRGGFTPTGGSTTFGSPQSFTLPAATTCQGRAVTVFLGLDDLPTTGADVILGTEGRDNIDGLGGNDVICGLGGNDDISGGAGDDVVDAGVGSDRVLPGPGTNRVLGGAGNDTVSGLGGKDTIDGGTGVDTVTYAGATKAITLDLAKSGAQNTGGGGLDTVRAVENAVGGKARNVLRGSSAGNRLTGGAGPDTLAGRAGNDVLVGAAGRDACDGGPGSDRATGCERRTSVP